MTVTQSLMAYIVAAGVLTLTPGVDTALVLRSSTANGAKAAAGAALGITTGLLVWGGIVALGIGGLLAASQVAYTALKWVGAAYLLYLGLKLLLKPRKDTEPAEAADTGEGAGAWWAKGFLTNLLNPKIGVFYVTFLPQFVPQGVSVSGWTFLLAVVHAALCVLWFAALIAASVPLGRALRRPRVVQILDRLTGGVFLAFGAKLVLSRN